MFVTLEIIYTQSEGIPGIMLNYHTSIRQKWSDHRQLSDTLLCVDKEEIIIDNGDYYELFRMFQISVNFQS